MASGRRVFFSFHFDRDVRRAAIVRESQRFVDPKWTFQDVTDWEKVRRTGPQAIRRWISEQMDGTSVTVVLIGAETSRRPWVKYEIDESIRLGKGLLGIYIHNIKDPINGFDRRGVNPLPSRYKVYDWVTGKSHNEIGAWIEKAARDAGY